MKLAAFVIYWIIIAIWSVVVVTVIVYFAKNKHAFGTTRLLLAVILVDTLRNITENAYFGIYFGGMYGFFPESVIKILGTPTLLILPKIGNVVSGLLVIGLLLGRWLPQALEERRLSETTAERLREQAAVDGMTGLYNRRHFSALAEAEWSRAQRYKRPLSLLMVDIDLFKSINDQFGHEYRRPGHCPGRQRLP